MRGKLYKPYRKILPKDAENKIKTLVELNGKISEMLTYGLFQRIHCPLVVKQLEVCFS
jgi:hypothetical protein